MIKKDQRVQNLKVSFSLNQHTSSYAKPASIERETALNEVRVASSLRKEHSNIAMLLPYIN